MACLVLKMLCNKFGISDATLAATTSISWERKGTSMDTEEKGMINCPKCGKEVAKSSRFCPFCRASLAGERQGAPEAPVEGDTTKVKSVTDDSDGEKIAVAIKKATTPEKSAQWTSIIGVSAGVVMLCFGAYAFFTASVGCDSTSFGGDAYTYIYKGIVATAKTLYLICRCLGMALMCVGAAMSCHFASRFGK